jgi:hypothetical protein
MSFLVDADNWRVLGPERVQFRMELDCKYICTFFRFINQQYIHQNEVKLWAIVDKLISSKFCIQALIIIQFLFIYVQTLQARGQLQS